MNIEVKKFDLMAANDVGSFRGFESRKASPLVRLLRANSPCETVFCTGRILLSNTIKIQEAALKKAPLPSERI